MNKNEKKKNKTNEMNYWSENYLAYLSPENNSSQEETFLNSFNCKIYFIFIKYKYY